MSPGVKSSKSNLLYRRRRCIKTFADSFVVKTNKETQKDFKHKKGKAETSCFNWRKKNHSLDMGKPCRPLLGDFQIDLSNSISKTASGKMLAVPDNT